MLDQVTQTVMERLGCATEDYHNNIVANEDSVRSGFFSEETLKSYINDAVIGDTTGLITAAGHEASHAMDWQDGAHNEFNDADREIYANDFGSNFASYTDMALDINGYDTGMANANLHVGNDSNDVQFNNAVYAALDKTKGDSYLSPDQLAAREAGLKTCGNDNLCQLQIARIYEWVNDKQDYERVTALLSQMASNVKSGAVSTYETVTTLPETTEKVLDGAGNAVDYVQEIGVAAAAEVVGDGLNDAADQQHQQYENEAQAYEDADSDKLGRAEGDIATEQLAGLTVPGGVGVVDKVLSVFDDAAESVADFLGLANKADAATPNVRPGDGDDNALQTSLVEAGRNDVDVSNGSLSTTPEVPNSDPAFSRLSQPGGLSATEGNQVVKFDGKLSRGTHPLEKHGPDVTDQYLHDRVAKELVEKNRTGLRTAFNDRAQMESAIEKTFSSKQSDINAWLASNPKAGIPQAFEADPGMGNLGRGYEVTTKGGPIVPITKSMPNVNVVLIPDGKGNYLIHTAHPF